MTKEEKKGVTIPNPLALWTSMTPGNKRFFMAGVVIVLIAMMFFGYMDEFLALFSNEINMKLTP
jgi:hypothetical protein